MVKAHAAGNVMVVQSWSNGFGCLVSWVDDARDVCHLYNASGMPFLEGKVLDVTVVCPLRGDLFVDNVKDGLIIFVHDRCSFLWESKVIQDRSKVLNHFGGRDCSD
jgi:hypothetical protein